MRGAMLFHSVASCPQRTRATIAPSVEEGGGARRGGRQPAAVAVQGEKKGGEGKLTEGGSTVYIKGRR